MPPSCLEFFDEYNRELGQLGSAARVAPPGDDWHAGSMIVLSRDGTEFGLLPDSVEPHEMAAIVDLLERSFARGREVGLARAL